jgi:choline kinase
MVRDVKAVLLAAGTSSRLRPLTNETPKCLLDVGGAPILRRALAHLAAAKVHEVVLVTGFQEQKIQAAVREWFPQLRVTLISNPDYATTNNAYSLLLTRERVAGREFILLDSDIVFEEGVLRLVMDSPHADCLALRPDPNLGAEEIKARCDAGGRVLEIGKTFDPKLAAGESIGIERFAATTSARLFEVLEERVIRRELRREFYEASFQQMIDQGLDMRALSVGGLYCTEIDTLEDLAAAKEYFLARAERVA